MISIGILLALLLVASWTDLRHHAIYNRTVYPGILFAFALNGIGEGLLYWEILGPDNLQRIWGVIGLGQSLAGFLLCGLIMLVCYVLFHVGGGDVKLIAMLGAFLGPYEGLEALLWTFVLGAAAGLMMLVWRHGPSRLLLRVWRQVVSTLLLRRWAPITDQERTELQTRLYLAPSALLAVLIVYWDLAQLI
ncbi:MAG: A24 family peptidase [Thermoguttaceae bacterium]|nr:A24 family peptidase [Thermoguttaceae bacterium]MDW8038262.1 A24 family peptidase [Thermoguttaceae bacterium]